MRSLARQGVSVTAIAFEASDPVLHSRLAAMRLIVPGVGDAEKEANLLDMLRNLPGVDGAAILTSSDRLVKFLSRHEQELHRKLRYRLLPAHMLDSMNDKRKETALVKSLGFSIPATVSELPDEPAALARELRFPIIFKPHDFSVQEIFPLKNAVVRDVQELESFYAEWQHALSVLLAQEVIPGPDEASWICSCTFDSSHEMLDCGIKQKLRAYPPHFGGSTYAVSRTNAEILELARRLGKKLDYVGHAGIEFRWDERDKDYKYIEVNPRLPANVGFDEASGLPTVWNSYLVALGVEVQASGAKLKEDIYYLDLKQDFYSLQDDNMSKPQAMLTLLRVLLSRRTNGPYFAWDDPMPGLQVGWRFVTHVWRSIRHKARSKTPAQAQKA